MQKTQLCLPALWIGLVLMAGCAGIERAPQHRSAAATPVETTVWVEPRGVPTLVGAASQAVPTPAGTVASAPVAQAAGSSRQDSTSATVAKPPAATPQAPLKPAAAQAPVRPTVAPPVSPPVSPPVATAAAPPVATTAAPRVMNMPPPASPVVKPAGPPPLDLKSLELRLKETKAIGVFSKLALKNQIDDLLERFRAFYQGRDKTSLVELRRSFDMLVMKTLALLQDADAALASALASSRESIWAVLSDRTKFATV